MHHQHRHLPVTTLPTQLGCLTSRHHHHILTQQHHHFQPTQAGMLSAQLKMLPSVLFGWVMLRIKMMRTMQQLQQMYWRGRHKERQY
jgi:hypothetical protein